MDTDTNIYDKMNSIGKRCVFVTGNQIIHVSTKITYKPMRIVKKYAKVYLQFQINLTCYTI